MVNLLLKNQSNLDESLRLMAPFYRVFANTLGTGPWFDTWISEPAARHPPTAGVMTVMRRVNPLDRRRSRSSLVVAAAGRRVLARVGDEVRRTPTSRAPCPSTRAPT